VATTHTENGQKQDT